MHTKSLVLGIMGVATGIGFWFFFKNAIAYGNLDVSPVWIALVFLTAFLVCFSLLLLFADRIIFAAWPYVLGISPLFYFFGYSTLMLACFIVAILAMMRACVRVRTEAKSRINFRVRVLLWEGLPIIMTVLSLLFAAAYYTETKHAPNRLTLQDILPKAFFERVLLYTPTVSGALLPNLDPRMTVDEYAIGILKQNGIDISKLPPAEQSRILEEAQKQLFGPLIGERGGYDIPDGSTRLGDVLYDIITKRSAEFIAPYERFVPAGFAIAFFFFLRSVAFLLIWIIVWICIGIVNIGIRQGYVVRIEESTRKERLTFV